MFCSTYPIPVFYRHTLTITLDPLGRLAASTDGFGRVFLIDTQDNMIVRIWKGYRDAQCGWIQYDIKDDLSQVFALFLVIHAPRRGLIEVWRVKSGQREVVMDVGMGCKLLPTQTALGVSSAGKYQHSRCYLLRPSGIVEEITLNPIVQSSKFGRTKKP